MPEMLMQRDEVWTYYNINLASYDNLKLTMLPGNYFVYITTNPTKTVLYTGMTNDLFTRMNQHYEQRGNPKTFAGKYYCYKLLYYEMFSDVHVAIEREKEIKDLSREAKFELIRSVNPRLRFISLTPD